MEIALFNFSEIFLSILEIIYLVFFLDYLVLLGLVMSVVNIIFCVLVPKNQFLLIIFTISMSRIGIVCYLVLCMIVELMSSRVDKEGVGFIITQVMRGCVSVMMSI